MTPDEYREAWVAAWIAAGHEFQMQTEEDGDPSKINWFATYNDIHNGPRCTKCGWDCCMHCKSFEDIPKCTGGQS